MSNKDADLRIGADTSQANAEFDKLGDKADTAGARVARAFTAAGDQGKSAIVGIHDQVETMTKKIEGFAHSIESMFLGLTAILAGGALFKHVIGETLEETNQVMQLSRTFGIATEQASELNIALKLTGQSADDFSASAFKLLKQVQTNGDGIEALGLKTKDANGNLRPMLDLMQDAAQLMMSFEQGSSRDAAAQYLFGKSAQESMNILKLNAQVMDRARQIADQYNLRIGPEGVEAARKYKQEQAAVGLVMEAMTDKIGEALLPELTKLAGWFTEVGPTVIDAFMFVLKNLIQFIEETVTGVRILWDVLSQWGQDIGTIFGGVATALQRLMSRDLDGAKAAMSGSLDEINRNAKTHADERVRIETEANARIKMLWAAEGDGAGGDGAQPKGGHRKFVAPEKETGGTESYMQQWEAYLEQQKVVYEQTHNLHKMSLQDEVDYWQSAKKYVEAGSNDYYAINKKIAELQLQDMRRVATERRGVNAESINEQEKTALDGVSIQEEDAQRRLALGEISKKQMLALQQQFEDQRTQIQIDAQIARINALQGDPNEDPVALQKELDKLNEIQRAHATRTMKLQTDMAKNAKDEWAKMMQPITNAIDKSVTGVIMGTTTVRKAMSNLLQSIVAETVSAITKMVANWAAGELAKTGISKSWSAIRAALGWEEAGATEAAKTAEASAVIGANAGEAASGAAASQAAIPVVGPGLAAAAFAATMAMVLGAKSLLSARGGFDIPAGINPLTQLHEREMVLPATLADTVRGMASGGGAGGSMGMNVTIHAMDGQDVRRVLMRNTPALAAAGRRAARNYAPTSILSSLGKVY